MNLKIISLSFSFIIIGISIGSYALISIRDLCLSQENFSERMNHIGRFIPIILVISFLLKFIINLIFLYIKDLFSLQNYYFYLFMILLYLSFNLIGYYLKEEKELQNIDLPLVFPCISQSLKRLRIWNFILLYLVCKIEKLLWQIIFTVNSFIYFESKTIGLLNLSLRNFSLFIVFIPPILFGYILDKYDFIGFKWILYSGCFVNIVTCIYCFILLFLKRIIILNSWIYILSIINEIFRSGNYAIFLPEIIKKFEIKNLLIISGLISSTNLIIEPIENLLINYFIKYSDKLLFKEILILLVFQLICSFVIFILLFLKGVNENIGMEKGNRITYVKSKDILFKIEEENEIDDDDYEEDINHIQFDNNNKENKEKEENNDNQNNENYNDNLENDHYNLMI